MDNIKQINPTMDKIKEQPMEKCPFCNGTGLCRALDAHTLPEGTIGYLNRLINEYGVTDKCPEGCIILN